MLTSSPIKFFMFIIKAQNHLDNTILHLILYLPYCPFDITWKDSFCLPFYLKWKYFVLTDHILSETICLFCFCVLFSNIYPKIKFMAKTWSDLGNFCIKWFFVIFVWENIFYFSLLNLNYWCFTTIYYENFRKVEQAELVENLPPLPTLQISA